MAIMIFADSTMDDSKPPLYCFKVVDDKFNLEKIVITNYHKRVFSSISRKYAYSWDSPNIVKGGQKGYCIESNKLDHYANEKVFTFTDDIDAVYRIIFKQLKHDLTTTEIRYKNKKFQYDSLTVNHPEVTKSLTDSLK